MNGAAGITKVRTVAKTAYHRLAPETMSFRARMVFAALVVGGFAILAASLGAYLASRNALVNSVNGNLQQTTNLVLSRHTLVVQSNGLIEGVPPGAVAQFYPSGAHLSRPVIPVSAQVRSVAASQKGAFYADVSVEGQQYREYVTPLQGVVNFGITPTAGALQVAAPLAGVNNQLGHLGLALLLVALIALTLAALLGWLASRTAVGPLDQLTATVERLARTMDVSERLDPGGPDELGRLRRAFNRLLGALEASRESQHQLVVDASHELRTPLTSLRTNLEIIRRIGELPAPEREVLVADVLTQLQELTNLVGDLAELARGEPVQERAAPVRLDHLVEDAVELAASHGRRRGVSFLTSLDETWVEGRSERIARAVGNLLDNALKWSPDGGTVEVLCRGGDISVRDHGPGIDQEDLPHIFDRFYRARAARALPGSGLGLAIVAQVASEEGGSVRAVNAPDGGAIVTLHLPMLHRPAEVASQR
jgi:two-component system, OmpR family, sensor histidine kinase MprB